jgi:hypothetical protein
MLKALRDIVIARVQQRVAEADCPTIPAESVEILEQVICDLTTTPAPDKAVMPEAAVGEPRVDRWRKASIALGAWMSAALDDPAVCEAMKADIREWFSAGEPFEGMALAATNAGQVEASQTVSQDRAVEAWQPIETAPPMKTVVMWCDTSTPDLANWRMDTGYKTQDGCFNWNGRIIAPWDFQPTHWMPLPSPPAFKKSEVGHE